MSVCKTTHITSVFVLNMFNSLLLFCKHKYSTSCLAGGVKFVKTKFVRE
jgi:hypothetical protein